MVVFKKLANLIRSQFTSFYFYTIIVTYMSSTTLGQVLILLAKYVDTKFRIDPNSDILNGFDISSAYRAAGLDDETEASEFTDVFAFAPVEAEPLLEYMGDVEKRVKDYVQLSSGLTVPLWVAEMSELDYHEWKKPDGLRIMVGRPLPD